MRTIEKSTSLQYTDGVSARFWILEPPFIPEQRAHMAEQTTLVLTNDISELDRVTTFISSLCAREAIDADMEYGLLLALDEIITNIIVHSDLKDRERPITVRLSLNEDEFVAQIEDEGREFDPTQHPTPDLDAPLGKRKIGGLGIHLVRQIMDSMEYERVEGKNLVTLRKKRIRSPQ